MRILWTHNYSQRVVSSGIFMHIMLRAMRDVGMEIDLMYTGNLSGIKGIVRAAKEIRALSRNYDLVHAQYGSACSWVTSFSTCPRIVTLRGTDLFGVEHGTFYGRLHGLLGRKLTHAALKSYPHVVVVSEQMRSLLEARSYHSQIEVIPSGIDLGHFHRIERSEARRRLGFANNTRPWVLVAGVSATNVVKRWPLAQQAIALLQDRDSSVELRTVSGVTHSEMPLWVNACDLVLVTSTHEGWPNIVKEGLACDVPFVSTDVSDLKRIAVVEPSCHVVDADPVTLAQAMEHTLGLGRPTSLRRHVDAMHLPVVVERYSDLYQQICYAADAKDQVRPPIVRNAA